MYCNPTKLYFGRIPLPAFQHFGKDERIRRHKRYAHLFCVQNNKGQTSQGGVSGKRQASRPSRPWKHLVHYPAWTYRTRIQDQLESIEFIRFRSRAEPRTHNNSSNRGKEFDFDKVRRRNRIKLKDILDNPETTEFEYLNEPYTLLDETRQQRSGLIFAGYRNKTYARPVCVRELNICRASTSSQTASIPQKAYIPRYLHKRLQEGFGYMTEKRCESSP